MKPQRRNNKIRLLLVDDHMVMRMGLVTAAGDQPDMEVVAECDNGADALKAFAEHKPDVVILDLRMPGGMGGLEVIRALRETSPEACILVFSNYVRGEEVHHVLRSGASGFVSKEMSLDRLLEAIRAVHRGERYIPPEVAQRMGERVLAQLSQRELEVIKLVARGMSNKQVGQVLNIVEGTVKIHVANILAKLGAVDRTQAIVIAAQRGIIDIV
jgi:DNA-binding NarL/FixJ family response regulator